MGHTVILLAIVAAFQQGGPQRPPAGPGSLTDADLNMAAEVIRQRTMIMPGLNPGSRFENGPGPFSASDAVILIALRYYEATGACVPADSVAGTLVTLQDQELHRKHALNWWMAFCGRPYAGGLRDRFDMYILEKTTARTRRANQALRAQVQADEAWRRVMNSQISRDQKRAESEAKAESTRREYLKAWNEQWSRDEANYAAWRASLMRQRAPAP